MAIAAVSLSLAACTNSKDVKVESVELDHTSLVLAVGSTAQLSATVKPENATNKAVQWSTNVDNVEVSDSGLVTAKKVGSAIVSVTTLDGGKKAECQVTVEEAEVDPKDAYEIDPPVNPCDSYVSYLNAIKAASGDERTTFVDLTQSYAVGDDNKINVKPTFHLYDKNDNDVDQDLWAYDFEFKFEEKQDGSDTYIEASTDDYSIVDARKADIKFGASAIGKTFRVTVMPGELSETQKASKNFKAEYEFEIVDGYNVYEAKELSYIDVRHGEDDGDWHPGDVSGFRDEWDAFKDANGLDKSLAPNAFILHKNIKITQNDVPANVLYNKAEATAAGLPSIEGTWKDTAHPYTLSTDRHITINGNYFLLDSSELVLGTRPEGGSTNLLNSHTALFRTVNGSLTVKNINATGNAPKADSNEGNIYAGGLMFVKSDRRTTQVEVKNSLARNHFITCMSGEPSEGYSTIKFDVNDCKFYDNYCTFFYNWGGEVTVKDSILRSCGGPIVIQDHTGVGKGNPHEEKCGSGNLQYYKVFGMTSHTTFDHCTLENYLLGEEAWFIQYGGGEAAATALVDGIRQISDLLYYGSAQISQATQGQFPLMGYVVDGKDHNPVLSDADGDKVFNLIALNKSGTEEGATALPVSGEVTIINSNDGSIEDFDYCRPDKDFSEDLRIVNEGSQEEIMALFAKYGVSSPEALTMALMQRAGEVNYEREMLTHGGIRALNGGGAPVLETAGRFGWTDTSGFYDVYEFAKYTTNPTDPYKSSVDATYFTGAGQHVALYYQGMQIVFELARSH